MPKKGDTHVSFPESMALIQGQRTLVWKIVYILNEKQYIGTRVGTKLRPTACVIQNACLALTKVKDPFTICVFVPERRRLLHNGERPLSEFKVIALFPDTMPVFALPSTFLRHTNFFLSN